ncbi:hypothetical protein PF005_g17535 [Phytophthora fragariae]|uniref:Uncharacterized protein n=1 Tax=Phytophthora fragariae TaxID=53985 RepID=A0A6A3ENN2_9STRA|nr:hypothetical protein PF009_g16531 [Phytophthora fragariae]KAE9194813.1 hypothetical protein PF005_g17535 [Phytophthora fragariae]KAE9217842.1 hypothetical protein PF002_g16679 [Phytophthora fragariae]KAE9326454.1 hypothetical protein PF008_g16640 [Phytophthora fragariae]
MSEIPNYGASLPKQYRGSSVGDIKELGIKKLFRMIVLGPSYSGPGALRLPARQARGLHHVLRQPSVRRPRSAHTHEQRQARASDRRLLERQAAAEERVQPLLHPRQAP